MPDETGTADLVQDLQHISASGMEIFTGTAAIAQDEQIVTGVGKEIFTSTGSSAQDEQAIAGAGQTFAGVAAVTQDHQRIASAGIAYPPGATAHTSHGPQPGGNFSLLDLSATTLVKGTAMRNTNGVINRVNVTTAGSTTGALYDFNATSGYGAENLIGVIPTAVGSYEFQFPFFTGLVFVPGTNMVASLAYS